MVYKTDATLAADPETDRESRIRELAHMIWEEEGRPEGRANDHWHKAAAIVAAEIEVARMQPPDWLKRDIGAEETVVPAWRAAGSR